MGLIARLFLWLITLRRQSLNAPANRTQPESTPDIDQPANDDGQEIREQINHAYDSWGHDNWVEYIQFNHELDPYIRHYDNAS